MGSGNNSNNTSSSPVNTTSSLTSSMSNPLGSFTSMNRAMTPNVSMNIDFSFMKNMGITSTSSSSAAQANELTKTKQASEADLRNQLNEVISLLDNVRLQSPSSHLGLVVAYSSDILAPLSNPGLK